MPPVSVDHHLSVQQILSSPLIDTIDE